MMGESSANILNLSESALNSLKKSDLVQKIVDFKGKVVIDAGITNLWMTPEPVRANQSHPKSSRAGKNHQEATRASQSQPVANENPYFILFFILEHSYLFLWTNYR